MGTSQTTAAFLGLTDLPGDTQTLKMETHLLGGGSGSLFGGVGVAVALIALEKMTGQAPVYMTCQFASTARPPDELVFTTEILAQGRTVSQARTTATNHGETTLALLGATGDRTESHHGRWATMPAATPPEELESLNRIQEVGSLHDHVEVRMARGSFGFAPEETAGRGTHSGDASTLFWVRMPEVQHDTGALALLADYLPSAVGNALGEQVFCSSLDNTVRLSGPMESDPTSEWILCESHVEFVGAGFAANRGFLWSRDGKLLASANQSVTVARPRV